MGEITLQLAGKNRKHRKKGKFFPVTESSARLYCRINPAKVHLFRYLLEAEDNLGIMTVVDRWGAVLQVRFSPHQERAVRAYLFDMQGVVPFEILELPRM
jgi:hypothetical protein